MSRNRRVKIMPLALIVSVAAAFACALAAQKKKR